MRRAALAALLSVGLVTQAAAQEPVRLYAAGSLRAVLEEVGARFTAETGTKVAGTFGASGLLRERISKGENAEVMYTADQRALKSDEIFVDFITGSHDAFVIEDSDLLLTARTSGNEEMHRFLAIADGVARSQGRKIIFTTNLPNVNDIDEALVRPGRCYAVKNLRGLTLEEASAAMDLDLKHLQKVEAGQVNVTLVTVLRVADGLGVPPALLFGEGAAQKRRKPRGRY